MNRICVFCGSKPGNRPAYVESARALGRALVARGCGLVYGGASVGVMTEVADTVLEAGGEVIGVIPETLLQREVGHRGLTELHVVQTMHERKALMASRSDAFIGLPGGYGTFEELFEVITWGQLGIHRKPVGLLNVAGYYDAFMALVDHAVAEGFIPPSHRGLILVDTTPEGLLDQLEAYQVPDLGRKWADKEHV
ncbi:TIGR00730 family Rossman fold protein [bacterium]|nr:TIGR00730 family Rossman fold protein [bacterium]